MRVQPGERRRARLRVPERPGHHVPPRQGRRPRRVRRRRRLQGRPEEGHRRRQRQEVAASERSKFRRFRRSSADSASSVHGPGDRPSARDSGGEGKHFIQNLNNPNFPKVNPKLSLSHLTKFRFGARGVNFPISEADRSLIGKSAIAVATTPGTPGLTPGTQGPKPEATTDAIRAVGPGPEGFRFYFLGWRRSASTSNSPPKSTVPKPILSRNDEVRLAPGGLPPPPHPHSFPQRKPSRGFPRARALGSERSAGTAQR